MLAPHDYDRYRVVDDVVRRPDLRIAWAEVDGRRVQLVTAPPVPGPAKLTVLRRLAERESLALDVACPYLAGGVDERRTWVAFAAAEGPTLQDLADAVAADAEFAAPAIAARVVGDAAAALREVLKRAPSLPAAGVGDARVGIDGRLVLGHLGEVWSTPRLDEATLSVELGRWLGRLTGSRGSDPAYDVVQALAGRAILGEIRRLAELADELDEVGGTTRGAIAAWLVRIAEQRPRIAAPALIEELDLPPDPEPPWAAFTGTPSPRHEGTPGPSSRYTPLSSPSSPVRTPMSGTPSLTPRPSADSRPGALGGHARATFTPAPRPTPSLPPHHMSSSTPRPVVRSESESVPAAGTVVGGRYRLVQRVANGMMGRVYEATRLSDDQRVALKLLQPSEDDPQLAAQYQARFRREAEALARLDHPNIVRVYECGFDTESWLAMEYVDGSTLAKILRSRGHLPASEVLQIARQLCAALDHAHDQGVVHRDLKPANVILVRDDPRRVRLVDFGLAKDWDGSADLTNDGTLLGTPHYMSPEQCNGDPARIESDLYALGMLMYRLLTGRMPFEGKRGAAILLAHTASPVPTFQSLGLGFSIAGPIERVVRKCLEKRPENRFRTAAELDRALLACTNGTPVVFTPVAAPPRVERFPVAWSRRSVVASVVGVALLAFLAVGTATGATVAWLLGHASPEVAAEPVPAAVVEPPKVAPQPPVQVNSLRPAPVVAPAAPPAAVPAPRPRPPPRPRPKVPAPSAAATPGVSAPAPPEAVLAPAPEADALKTPLMKPSFED